MQMKHRQREGVGERKVFVREWRLGQRLVHNGVYHVPFLRGEVPHWSLWLVKQILSLISDSTSLRPSSVYVPFPWTWRLAHEHSGECLLLKEWDFVWKMGRTMAWKVTLLRRQTLM